MTPKSPRRANRSAGEPESFFFTYDDIEALTGKARNSLYQHCRRGSFDPNSLESVCYFIARHAKPKVKTKLLAYALETNAKNPAE